MTTSVADRLAERIEAVGGRVSRVSRSRLAEQVVEVVEEGKPVLVTPELGDLAADLNDLGLEAAVGTREAVSARGGESLEDLLDRAGSGVVRSYAAIASSGTLAVGPGGGNGGLLAAFPPHTVIIVEEDSIRERMADVLPEVSSRFEGLGGETVFVSGPSRTADIEMMSVVGVHGPTTLDVIVVGKEEA